MSASPMLAEIRQCTTALNANLQAEWFIADKVRRKGGQISLGTSGVHGIPASSVELIVMRRHDHGG
jgi:hypothetical protein